MWTTVTVLNIYILEVLHIYSGCFSWRPLPGYYLLNMVTGYRDHIVIVIIYMESNVNGLYVISLLIQIISTDYSNITSVLVMIVILITVFVTQIMLLDYGTRCGDNNDFN